MEDPDSVMSLAAAAGHARIANMVCLSPPPAEDLDLRGSLRATPARRGKGDALAAVSPSFALWAARRVIPLRGSPLCRRSLGPYPVAIEAS